MNWTIITSLLSTIAIVIMLFQLKHLRQQLRLNFFMEYTKRYQEIMLHLPLDIFSEEFRLEKYSDIEQEIIARYFNVYIDLCSEEYYLHKNRNIDKKVWAEWEKGMSINFKTHGFAILWPRNKDYKFYDDFKYYVNGIINE